MSSSELSVNNETDDTARTIREMLAERAQIPLEAVQLINRITDLGIDSMGVFEVVFDIEKRFTLKIPDAAVDRVQTVGELVSLVNLLRSANKLG